jgi:spermidine/putrescine transport system ATP-binding protein
MTKQRGEDGPILELRAVSKIFGSQSAVNHIDLDIRDGEFFTIVGPSGSGKSTLIRMLAGLETPSKGDILLRGRRINDVPANKRPTAMVFQSLALFNHKTVGDNIGFALKMRGVAKVQRTARALELLDLVRLPKAYIDRMPGQCSGGERQRIALARALASDPEILFFDEPLSAIDYQLRKILEVEMKELHQRTGKTFIYITHSLEEAMVMSDRIAVLSRGAIVQVGVPRDIYRRPANRFVAAFMGEVNLFRVESQNGFVHLPEIDSRLEPDSRIPEAGYLVLRPENLRLLAPDEHAQCSFEASVASEFVLGSRTQLHVSRGERRLLSEIASDHPSLVGSECRFGFNLHDTTFVRE